MEHKKSGRGTTSHVANRFHEQNYISDRDFDQSAEEELTVSPKTKCIEVIAKSMINVVKSPDLPMDYSLNPYQGCEHGCIYCYARPTHNYWGYSAADDFETKIMVKTNAVEILKKELSGKKYIPKPIVLSGNTDCYQPVEKKYGLTRKILELMLEWKHPVMIITKNALIKRDLDLLDQLNQFNLVRVAISVTASQDATRRIMEPRASSILSRLSTIRLLSKLDIPVHAMLAPIIPGINSHEIFEMVSACADAGAKTCSYQIVRLNGDLQQIFEDWLEIQMPEKKDKVFNQIKSCHGGSLSDSRFKIRMKGEGNMADIIKQQFLLAKTKYFQPIELPAMNLELFRPPIKGMRSLW